MISEINLNNTPSCWSCYDSTRRPLCTDIFITITSIAVSILISTPLAIATATPLGLIVGSGATIGLILAIAIITYRRFSSKTDVAKEGTREKPLALQTVDQNKLSLLDGAKAESTETSLEKEKVRIHELSNIQEYMDKPFPQSFHRDILFSFFSCTGLSLKTLQAIACTSKEINALVYMINEMRLKKVEKLPLYIGLEAWKDFGWFYPVGDDDRAPLIFPDILEKFNEDKGTAEKQAILLMPNMLSLSNLQMCAMKSNPTLKSVYSHIDKEVEKQYFQKVPNPYFVVITLNGISGSGKKTLGEQSKMVSSFAGLSGYHYRLPHLVEVVALTYLCRLKFGLFLFSRAETRTLDRLPERKRATVGDFTENKEQSSSGLFLGSADARDNFHPMLLAVAASSATKNDLK